MRQAWIGAALCAVVVGVAGCEDSAKTTNQADVEVVGPLSDADAGEVTDLGSDVALPDAAVDVETAEDAQPELPQDVTELPLEDADAVEPELPIGDGSAGDGTVDDAEVLTDTLEDGEVLTDTLEDGEVLTDTLEDGEVLTDTLEDGEVLTDVDPTDIVPDGDAATDAGPDTADGGPDVPPEPDPCTLTLGGQEVGYKCPQVACATVECVGTGTLVVVFTGQLELGECVVTPQPEGSSCAAGDACTAGTCQQGECVNPSPVACDGPCHTGTCDPVTGCEPIAEGTPCDDGDPSTFSSECTLAGECIGENGCDDGNPCTFDLLFNNVCQNTIVEGAGCDDDGDPCTADLCDASGACTHPPSAVGDPCEALCGTGTCDASGACTNVVEECQPANPCGVGVCDGANGCITVYDDPDCTKAGAQCNWQQNICTSSWCGDGWCGANEGSPWCEDCNVACYGTTSCSKFYNEVTWAGAYKANASVAYGFPTTGAHQTETFSQMLDDGIRWLHLVIDYCIAGADSGDMCLCAGDNDCLADPMLLKVGLDEIRAWMDANPEAIVTLKLQEYVNDSDLFGAIVASGLDKDLYQRWSYVGNYETWPMNLANMANKHRRLVIFGGGFLEPWQLYVASEYQPADPQPGDTELSSIFTVSGPENYKCTELGGDPPDPQQLYVIEDIELGIFESTSWSLASCQNIFSYEHAEFCKEVYSLPRVNAYMFQFYNSAEEPIKIFTPFTSPYSDQCDIGVDTCTSSDDCSSGVCSVWGVCITCADDADCDEDQFCSQAWNTCLTDHPDGSLCTSDSQCQSGNCGVLCYSCTTDADCDADQWCDVFGGCQAKKPVGFGCLSNTECIDDNCYVGYCAECNEQSDCDAGDYCDLNVLPGESSCVPTKPLGGGCVNPFECSSGACYTATCVECDAHADCAASEYCTLDVIPPIESICEPKKPIGDPCGSGVECVSGGCFLGSCGECSDDGACASGEFCAPDLTCQPKVGIGTACAIDKACLSGNCYLLFCAECNEHADCPADEFCTLDVAPGASACAPDKPNGSACTSGQECQSDVCTVVVCGECASDGDCGAGEFCNAVNECQTKAAIGASCLKDSGCQSGNCFGGFCVECNDQGDCGSGEYCTLNVLPGQSACAPLKSNGSACGSPVECASDACYSAICGECDAHADCASSEYCTLSIGSASTCEAKKSNGSGCASAVECSSNACTLFTCGECVSHSDCPSGEWCDVGNTCQPKSPNGTACVGDVECSSGNCWGVICAACDEQSDCSSSQYCTLNVPDYANSKCASKKSNGSGCGSDVECSSGICSLGTCVACTAVPKEGCNFSSQYCLGAQCYNKKANGQSCGADDQCTSGKCAGGKCETPCNASNDCTSSEWCSLILGACQPKKNNGTGCTDNQQCSSGICNVGTCVECNTHDDCNDNQYCDNVIGASFTCKADVPNGSGCNTGEWCQSGLCSALTCVDCLSNNDCSSSEFCLGNNCNAKKADGQGCAFSDQCISGCCSVLGFVCGGIGC